ncbi:MAG: hypothetical protein ABSE86_11925 [Bryobacteraceae bacterium]|jgi:hypothetical protein
MEELQYLRELEQILTEQPTFGDSAYIHLQASNCYEHRLSELSPNEPEANVVRDALQGASAAERNRVLGNPVVRFAVNSALRQIANTPRPGLPLEECREVFRATVEWLVASPSRGSRPLGPGRTVSLGTDLYEGGVWDGEHDGDVFTRVFRKIVKERFGHKCQPGAELSVANRDDVAMLAKGVQLLDELAPTLSRSALSHVHLIAFFPLAPWNGAASMSQFGVSGAILLSRDLLHSPWWTAEHLLHEALHQKLYDFRLGHTLLVPNFAREDAPRVCSLWNIAGANKLNLWDAHRAMAAFHVYVHLALLSSIAEERASDLEPAYGPLRIKPGMTSSRKAMERAHYLGEQLGTTCDSELGLAGKSLVEWLIKVLTALDPAPPPAGSHIHLLLGRYRGEARTAQKKFERLPLGAADLGQRLLRLALGEVENTRNVLAEVSAKAELDQFEKAVGQCNGEDPARDFVQLRDLICRTILLLSPDGYRLNSAKPGSVRAELMVAQMVEDSSRALHSILVESVG